MLVKIVIFSVFGAKKARNLQQIFAKKHVFLVCIQMLVDCFIPQKCVLREKSSFFGNKTVDQRSGANLKKPIFCKKITANFLLF